MQNDENVKKVLTFAPLSLIIVSRGEAKRVPTQAGSSHSVVWGPDPRTNPLRTLGYHEEQFGSSQADRL